MSKSKEELNKIKEEVEAVNEKLAELTEEEIAQVNGGLPARYRLFTGQLGTEIDHYPYREYDN